MGRGLGFQQQQQCHGDDGMWMDTHAQHQQGYGFHQDSWDTMPNNYAHHGYGNKLGSATHSYSHHQFSNGGTNKFDSGGHHGGYKFAEYEIYNEEHHGAGKVKVNEMKYERRNYGGGDHGFHANPYGHGGYKGVWIAKGV
ncbi:unnamed protein product [Lupinus luteus]|uniref:Uncharacterized protein n=1 Tax=Lupinus luteus TaxID=3873 RepID=A0AAV1XGT7_LUPLU